MFSFGNNEPVSWFDSDGTIPLKADGSSGSGYPAKKDGLSKHMPDGGIRCNEKCEMESTGCDKWDKILQPCCQKHEAVHIGQVGGNFCKSQTVTKTLPSGEKKDEKCCPDAGKVPEFETTALKNLKQWPDGECPGYKASVECMDALLDKDLSSNDRRIVLGQLGWECGLMKANKCPDIPSACDNVF